MFNNVSKLSLKRKNLRTKNEDGRKAEAMAVDHVFFSGSSIP